MSIADRVAKRFLAQEEHLGVAPPGWDKSVERMKKDHKDEIDNPFALAWYMHNKGDKPHPKKKEGEEQEEASISRPGPMASRVLKRAGMQPDGSVTTELEAANVHEGDGGLFISILQNENPNKMAGASDKLYRTFKLVSRVSHYGVGMESEFPLSSGSAVRWLIGALQRTLPVVEAYESSYTKTDYKARPTIMGGKPVPDTRQSGTDSQAEWSQDFK